MGRRTPCQGEPKIPTLVRQKTQALPWVCGLALLFLSGMEASGNARLPCDVILLEVPNSAAVLPSRAACTSCSWLRVLLFVQSIAFYPQTEDCRAMTLSGWRSRAPADNVEPARLDGRWGPAGSRTASGRFGAQAQRTFPFQREDDILQTVQTQRTQVL